MATQMQIKEKEMLDNASIQANSIIANAQNISSTSKNTVEGALQQMAINLEQNAAKSTSDYLTNYKNFLNQISQKSLEDFQGLAKNFEGDMDAKMKEFRDSLLPALQKELEAYKNKRFIEADKNVNEIVQKVAQKVLNKAISMEDHKNLIIESLEKARRENIFD
jgi:hypothetical protein